MMEFIRNVIHLTFQRIVDQVGYAAPGILAGLLILLIAYCLAWLVRRLLLRIIKGIAIDRFLRQSGLGPILDTSGKLRAAELIANGAFWLILLFGVLTAINALGTQITSRITEAGILLIPKIVTAAAIIIAGIWLGRYLGRHALVWSVNEGVPSGRKLAAVIRILVIFVAVAAAAEQLNFARDVFLATLIIVVGGIVFALSLAFGLYGKEAVRRYLEGKSDKEQSGEEMSIWRHL